MSDPETIFNIYKKALLKDLLDSPELQSLVDAKVQQKIDALHIDRQYYTPTEYASVKKIKLQTVYKLCRDKHLPHERIGNSIRLYDVTM